MKKMKIIFVVLVVSLAFNLLPTISWSQSPIQIYINGVKKIYEQPPIVQYSTTLVPMRGIFESLGAKVVFNSSTRQITGVTPTVEVKLTIGQKIASVNQNGKIKKLLLGVPAQSLKGNTMVPLRFISEVLGSNVSWNPQQRIININQAKPKLLFSVSKKTLLIGETIQSNVTLLNFSKKSPFVQYFSNRPDILHVDDFGRMTGKSLGVATITATTENVESSIKVEVTNIIWINDEIVHSASSGNYGSVGVSYNKNQFMVRNSIYDLNSGKFLKKFANDTQFYKSGIVEYKSEWNASPKINFYSDSFKAEGQAESALFPSTIIGSPFTSVFGDKLFYMGGQKKYYLYDTSFHEILTSYHSTEETGDYFFTSNVASNYDESIVAIDSTEGKIHLYDMKNGQFINKLNAYNYAESTNDYSFAFNPGDYHFGLLIDDRANGVLSIINPLNQSLEHRISFVNKKIRSFAFSPSGKFVVVGDNKGTITIFNLSDYSVEKTLSTKLNISKNKLNEGASSVEKLSFAKGDKKILAFYSSNYDPNVICWDTNLPN